MSAKITDKKCKEMLDAGLHRELVASLPPPGKTSTQTMTLIAALSFLGSLDEATALYKLRAKKLTLADRSRCRFTLGIAYVRIAKFKTAKILLGENLSEPGAKAFPDTWQGLGIYYYYIGRFHQAQKYAQKAMTIAIAKGDNYIRSFASDLYGHSMVRLGRRAQGIQHLEAAQSLNPVAANRFLPQKLIYEAEAGLRPQSILSELEDCLQSHSEQNSYTSNNLILEIARQWTLRGKWAKARKLLDNQAQSIYRFENRRQELTLQLRLAEIAYRQGEAGNAQHFLMAARRYLNKLADRAYELEILGIELKIARDLYEDNDQAQKIKADLTMLANQLSNPSSLRMLARISKLSVDFLNPGEDPMGDLMDEIHKDPNGAENKVLALGYLGLWPQLKGIKPGSELFYLKESGEWIAVSKDEVHIGESALSKQSQKILRALSMRKIGKEELISEVWNYKYDPLRHDSMVYSAMATLRKGLGPIAPWIVTYDDGWSFTGAKIQFEATENKPTLVEEISEIPAPLLDQLNWRQASLIRRLGSLKKWQITDHCKAFDISTMTAWRDLDGLVKLGYLDRVGKGRATAYFAKGEL